MRKVTASIETNVPKEPPYQGYVTSDGMWAAIPYGKQYIIIHNGFQVQLCKTLRTAKTFITKEMKRIKNDVR